jgi:hypothetical protein
MSGTALAMFEIFKQPVSLRSRRVRRSQSWSPESKILGATAYKLKRIIGWSA